MNAQYYVLLCCLEMNFMLSLKLALNLFLNIVINSSRTSYNCIYYIHPWLLSTTPPRATAHFLHPQLNCVLSVSLVSHQTQFAMPIDSWVWSCTLLKENRPCPPKVTSARGSSVRAWSKGTTSLSMPELAILILWSSCELMTAPDLLALEDAGIFWSSLTPEEEMW